MLEGYRNRGKSFFVHGNRGRKPATTVSSEIRATVVDLYRTKYAGANFKHFTELLARCEDIRLYPSTVTSILEEQHILSPMATKAKKRRVKKELERLAKEVKTQKESKAVEPNIIALENAHLTRPRVPYFGELIQMDASSSVWFGGEKSTLHVAVDDSTGAIVGAWFDKEETLDAYYHVLEQILKNHGIPYKFLTDRRTVFTYKNKNSSYVEDDTYTQFAYACKQLGIGLEPTSVPQTRGHAERRTEHPRGKRILELLRKRIQRG